MDIDAFLSSRKSIVIAPAGHGKTYSIASCVEAYSGSKKVLILTHTHAGVASIKTKLDQMSIESNKYHVETICSIALDLTNKYHINKSEIPLPDNSSALFTFATQCAQKLIMAKPIRDLFCMQYDHLIVDEYQDCTQDQHKLIMSFATFLKTHILGDPMQGIFGFHDKSIDFNDDSPIPFYANSQTLDNPWRWINSGKYSLGAELSAIRTKLENNEDIDLTQYKSIEYINSKDGDELIYGTDAHKALSSSMSSQSVLIIHPVSTSPRARLPYIYKYPQLQLLESIDDKEFYSSCHNFDRLSGKPLVADIISFMYRNAKKTEIKKWINENGKTCNKRDSHDKTISADLANIVDVVTRSKTYTGIANLIEAIGNLPQVRVYRPEIVSNICKSLRDADRLGISAHESISLSRNIIRQKGKTIKGRCIGTTLLTKGLEFDTVIILKATSFTDPNNLYVALTRCCKKLIVLSAKPVLHPYQG